jgi:chromosome segregation ATPase
MEIVYNGGEDQVKVRFDNGQELTLGEILSLEKALTLTRTSREWNRRRVVELEAELEGRVKADGALSTTSETSLEQAAEDDAAEIQRLREEIASLREDRQLDHQEMVALRDSRNEYNRDRHTEQARADQAEARLEKESSAHFAHAKAWDEDARKLRNAVKDRDNRISEMKRNLAKLSKAVVDRNAQIEKLDKNWEGQSKISANLINEAIAERNAAQAKIVELIQENRRTLDAIRSKVEAHSVVEALDWESVTPGMARDMREAIRAVRAIVFNASSLPTPPTEQSAGE